MTNRFQMTTVLVLLLVALASIGVGFALWSKTLDINGTVNTGSVDAVFTKWFTNDDNIVNNDTKDPGDVGDCAGIGGGLFGAGSCDPLEGGFVVKRYDKDVAECTAVAINQDMTLDVTIKNGYPSYWCTVIFDFKNTGSVPVKIFTLAAVGPGISAGHVIANWSELEEGQQIEPGQEVQGNLEIHVEQAAPQGGEIHLTGKIQLGQWNEYFAFPWATSGTGQAVGNTIVMGTLGDPEGVQQAVAFHGASAKLPAGSSYDVKFQYHVCTWDSYNSPGLPGATGWWDSFSVSTSAAPYASFAHADPLVDIAGVIDFGYLQGGNIYGDGVLDCFDGVATASGLTAYGGGTYLNVMLDTATAPNNNGNYPSYGTITIETVVVNP